MTTLAELLAPVSVDEFFSTHFAKRPLHIPGGGQKFKDLLPWRDFNRILSINNYWTEKTLLVYRDQQAIAVDLYTVPTPIHGELERRADPARVRALFADGATIIANYADTLTPTLNLIAMLLEESLFGYALANIYCSRFNRQGFRSHFDHHEVFAIQTEGSKRWRVYEGRMENPVQHPKFTRRPPGFDEAKRKNVLMEIEMKAGDLLYIPRGQYHDATASSEASLHVTYGVQPLCGLDVVSGILDRLIDDAEFRADLPPPAGDASALRNRLALLGGRLHGVLNDPAVAKNIIAAQRNRRLPRGGYDFPNA